MSWLDRLTGGFKKTADRLGDNLSGLASKVALDTATLDDIEEALIASDLGPEASKRIASPVQVTMKGGSLTIGWAPGGPISMRGAATLVFTGQIDL